MQDIIKNKPRFISQAVKKEPLWPSGRIYQIFFDMRL